MDIISEGVKGFFSFFMSRFKSVVDHWWDIKTGEKLPLLEFDTLQELIDAIENGEIVGEQDVKIRNVCVSNYAPLYLCYNESFRVLERELHLDAKEAAQIYRSLKRKYALDDSVSLFLEAAEGRLPIDSMFREYAEYKKIHFLGLSLARFGPITDKMCYGALYTAGGKIRNYTSPLANDVHLEPSIPLIYDPSIAGVIQSTSYVDAEVVGKVLPFTTILEQYLSGRGVQVFQRPYCFYVPNKKPYYINKTGLETWMFLDAWINFNLPTKLLNLPFFSRFEPTDESSRQRVCNEFQAIYDQLSSIAPTEITFYTDYVQPFVKRVKPILDIQTLQRCMYHAY